MATRTWIPNYFPNDRVVRRGFDWLASVTGRREVAALLVPARSWLSDGDVPDYLGEHRCAQLRRRGAVVRAPSGHGLTLVAKHGQQPGRFAGPVLTVYPEADLLEFLDKIAEVTHILVVPHHVRDAHKWISRWNAKPMQATRPTDSTTPSHTVGMALRRLASQSTNYDRRQFVDSLAGLLQSLLTYEEPFLPAEVETHLRIHAQPHHASVAGDVTRRVLAREDFPEADPWPAFEIEACRTAPRV